MYRATDWFNPHLYTVIQAWIPNVRALLSDILRLENANFVCEPRQRILPLKFDRRSSLQRRFKASPEILEHLLA